MERPAPQEIARRAYELWERGGRIHGQDQQYWFNAERELIGAATVAGDRPSGEIRSAEKAKQSSPEAIAAKTSVPPTQPAPATTEQDRPIGEIRPSQEAGAKRAAPHETDTLIKASRKSNAGAGAEDLAAQMAELQRMMTKGKPAPKPATKSRAKKPVAVQEGSAAISERKESPPK